VPKIRALLVPANEFQHFVLGIGAALYAAGLASQKIPSITKMLFRTLPP
jgi:hypothetical protein